MRNVPALAGCPPPAPVSRTWRPFPMRFGLGSHLVLPHFDCHSLTSCIMRSSRTARAGISHFFLRRKGSWKQAIGLLPRRHMLPRGYRRWSTGRRLSETETARHTAGRPSFGRRRGCGDRYDSDSPRGRERVCLADQARGCEDDACDECSEAAIQQDFIKDLGHDRFHSGTP